ncbi:O-methyltransferase [Ilumatobacter coccineus]|uniref:Putative O-methyltransferase n=1 Tax=Ilumatobacter coccineus (strain NBRC 103263 / KCTC 29153 / YM16-304) TaxID=1313172 RepID=A0A6C7DWW7_ILUCY|nr:class I SAM-dependent methyltransferase [Ilumatobacter coccineus]BAN01004.1 putative O-methyltransferase [Ilumatobacter coccineus YM16-304]
MSPRSIGLSTDLNDYVVAHTTPADDVQQQLIDLTQQMTMSQMQIAPDQGEFFTILTSLLQPKFVVEVGTFTGYSSLAIAKGLGPDGRILCCDVSEEWTAIAREHWEAAGVADRIELKIAPAIDTLRALPDDTVIDMAFIDADKRGYHAYYEEILARLADDGVILVDNTLWSGAVVDDSDTSPDTLALREFNDAIVADDRVRNVVLPIGDGVTMIRRAVTST